MTSASGQTGQLLDTGRHMHVDVKENENSYQVMVDAPGIQRSDFNISVDKDVLRINVEKCEEKEEKKEEEGIKWHRKERSSAFIGRALRMPQQANMEAIKAKYENGVLQLDIPKREQQQKAKQITVE